MTQVPEDLPEMRYRFLRRSGFQLSAISLGGWLTYGAHVDDGGLTLSTNKIFTRFYIIQHLLIEIWQGA